MKTAFCTISTKSHLFKAKTLLESIAKFSNADLFCLITDNDRYPLEEEDTINWSDLSELDSPFSEAIIKKYKGDKLRWACKPLYLTHLLQQGYDAVLYGDNDICFFNSPDFLFQKLAISAVLLTPHFYPADPTEHQSQLEANFKIGLFNAGFIGVNKEAHKALEWWAGCCAYNVKQAFHRGLNDDQKYLDLFPILFDDVHILKHRGCNVGAWSLKTSEVKKNDNYVTLNHDPLIFMHFNPFTIRSILNGEEVLLKPILTKYIAELKRFNPEYDVESELKNRSLIRAKIRHFFWKLERKLE